jgi:hypothetical protein
MVPGFSAGPPTQPSPFGPPLQQPAVAPAPGSAGATFPGLTTAAPQHAWWPAAAVSAVFPGLGLLFLRGRFRLALAVFGASVADHIVFRPLIAWAQPVIVRQVGYGGIVTETPLGGSPAMVALLTIIWLFILLVLMVGSAVYTHDETVRDNPQLGQALVFKQPLPLPPMLRG